MDACWLGVVHATGVELQEKQVFEESELFEGSWVRSLGVIEGLEEVELVVLHHLDLLLELLVGRFVEYGPLVDGVLL